MKSFSAILFLTVAGAWIVRAEIPDGWSTNYAAAMASADSAQQPALVFFTATWCGPCKLMSLTTLADPGVSRAISGIEHVAVDIDEHPDLAAKYGVTAVPTFILLSTSEDEAERITGFQASDDFLQWVTNGVSEAKADMVRQALARTNLAEVDRLLASTETNSIHEAAMELFDLCGERDTAVVQAAAARLKTMAGRDPSDLLDGLNDPRLAIRIQAANALRYKIGDAFDVDPWSDAVTREKRIPVWREQLAKTPGSKAAN